MRSLIATLALIAATTAAAADTMPARVFTICVPDVYWKDCVEMIEDSAANGIPVSCISGRDRYQCIEKVGNREADVVAVDPEDMYLTAKRNELGRLSQAGYSVVEQVRTKEEPEAPYRYEAVAVIHKDLAIDDARKLRGLKSCHTGVGRNVGYKIPIAKLTAMGVLHNLNDPEYSARENELRALSSLFSKGCLVGTWSPDPAIDRRLKETYSNMCALCEKPDVCDYPDIYSGYEGALRCLARNGGDVAWTKVIYAKRFFGLPVGVSPALPASANPADYRYFCPDGTKVAIDANAKPCTWAARPWQGYMTNGAAVRDAQAMQKELTDLGKLGEQKAAAWWKDIMLLNEKTLAVPAPPVSPDDHLKSAKYLDVIERDSGAADKKARWCVWSRGSFDKCRALAKASFSRDVRPVLTCALENSEEDCLRKIKDSTTDLTVVDGGTVDRAIEEFAAVPVIAETYGPGSTEFGERPAVAVIKKSSSIRELGDLRGKKSCHGGYKGDFAGWAAPVHALERKGLIASEEDVDDFFSASCAPGAPVDSKLCQQCVGSLASNDDRLRSATKCEPTAAEAYRGGNGALACLLAGKGDVAFVPLPALNSTASKDLALLCPDGGVAAVDDWRRCNLGLEPPRVIVSSASKTANALEELTHGILSASDLYAERPDLLHLFGSWGGESDLLFEDDAKGLTSVGKAWNKWNEWRETRRAYASA